MNLTRLHNEATALIPVAGLGTRMLPATKEMPKEMLPVPSLRNKIIFKPFIQIIFENLFNAGLRTFVFVVGRSKRILQDHFLPDWNLYETLIKKGKEYQAKELKVFYDMIEKSTIIWVDQPLPLGTGDAVMRGLKAITSQYTLIHFGDVLVNNKKTQNIIYDFLNLYEQFRSECDILIHSIPVSDPENYGVLILERKLHESATSSIEEVYKIKDLIEKPSKPPSKYAITGMYIVESSELFNILLKTPKNKKTGELELTDGLKLMLSKNYNMCTGVSHQSEFLDIGRPDMYLRTFITLSRNTRLDIFLD